MTNRSPASYPPGFQPLNLRDRDIDIAFDGEPAPLHHHFTATTLTCAASSGHPAFQAPYVAARMADRSMVILFVKSTTQPVQLVTLVIDADQRSVLAACHGITEARGPRWTLTLLRGAVGSRFSFADLTSFPLYQPSVRRVVFAPPEEVAGVAREDEPHPVFEKEAVFNRHGHLSLWRDSARAGAREADAAASGRMLSIGTTSAVLPWTTSKQGGTVIFDRGHATFWGFLTGDPLAPNLAPTATHGRIAVWD